MAYLTAAQIRDRIKALRDEELFPDADIADLVAEFEEVAEDYRGVAFTTRNATETFELANRQRVQLAWPMVQAISSVQLEGVTITSSGYALDGTCIDLISPRTGTLVVAYTHGYTSPPKRCLRACRLYVRSCALADIQNTERDAISQTEAGVIVRFSTPNKAQGRPTGWIEVDRLLNDLPDMRKPGIG